MTDAILADVLAKAAKTTPDAPALQYGEIRLSYAQLSADVKRIAAHLLREGLQPGDIVAVHVSKPLSHWVVTLALMRIGAVTVSLTSGYKAELAALASASAVICAPEDRAPDDFPKTPRRIHIDPKWLGSDPADAPASPDVETAAQTIARICFTSGTTGSAKPMLLDPDLLAIRFSGTAQRTGLKDGDVFWCGLGPDTAYGFTATLATWEKGGVVLFSDGRPGSFTQMRQLGVNVLLASPAALRPLLKDAKDRADGQRLGVVIVAGGRLSPAFRDDLLQHLCDRVEIAFGASETGGITTGDARFLDDHPGNVGPLFPDAQVEILDEIGAPVPNGEAGLLRMRTDSTVAGYLNAEDDTARNFRDGWFYSGDRAILSADGQLTILGRESDFLNAGGVKLTAPSLEAPLRVVDGVEDACAVVVDLPEYGPGLAIVITGVQASGAEIGPRIRATLPDAPKFYLISARGIPRNSMGKVNRDGLARSIEAGLAQSDPSTQMLGAF